MPTVETNGIETYYERRGSGPAIVFVHASILDHTEWRPQVRELSSSYETVTYDMRGHGRTGPSDVDPYSVKLFADDLAAFLDALELEQPIVCAHSLGGLVAQQLAAREPERLAGLVLADTFTAEILTAGEWLVRRLMLASAIPSARLIGYERVERANVWLMERIHRGSSGDYANIQRLRERGPSMETDEFVKVVRAMTNAHEHPVDLAAIATPTLVLYGKDEPPFIKRQAEHLAAHLPDVRLEEIPDAGHAANLDQSEAFNAAVRGFVEELAAAP